MEAICAGSLASALVLTLRKVRMGSTFFSLVE